MLEMSLAGKDHRDAIFVGTGDDLVVFLRAARLNYTSHTGLAGIFNISQARTESLF